MKLTAPAPSFSASHNFALLLIAVKASSPLALVVYVRSISGPLSAVVSAVKLVLLFTH